MPWRLNEEQQKKISASLYRFGEFPYTLAATATHDGIFVSQTKDLLSLCGWTQKPYTGGMAMGQPPMRPLVGTIGFLIVYDVAHEAGFGEVARALTDLLNSEGIASKPFAVDPSKVAIDTEALEIHIGSKPY